MNSSGFGNALDVIAPGAGILSTIPTNNTDVFSATSMASPHVAGLVALILSANKSLSSQQVRDIIERTAQKVGNFNYSITRPNGSWNQEVGYGLIDAQEAVEEAISLLSIIGPNSICVGSDFQGVLEIPTDLTISNIEWIVPNYPTWIRSGQGTKKLNFSFFSQGSANIKVNITLSNGRVILLEKQVFSVPNNSNNPVIEISPNNPTNLYCCNTSGYYNIEHAVLKSGYTNTNDLEWQWDIQYQNPNDYYGFNNSNRTAYISVQKHTFSPLIVSAKVRTINSCGSESSWSNEISRYYGTVSSFNSMENNSSIFGNYSRAYSNENLPLEEYYIQNEETLYINFLDVFKWLELKYSDKNLNDQEIKTIISILNNPKQLILEIYDINANLT